MRAMISLHNVVFIQRQLAVTAQVNNEHLLLLPFV